MRTTVLLEGLVEYQKVLREISGNENIILQATGTTRGKYEVILESEVSGHLLNILIGSILGIPYGIRRYLKVKVNREMLSMDVVCCCPKQPTKGRERYYGQTHVIARSMIDRLISSMEQLKSNGVSLTQISIEMQNCETALSQMNCDAVLDSLTTLELVVHKLPHELQIMKL